METDISDINAAHNVQYFIQILIFFPIKQVTFLKCLKISFLNVQFE